MKNIAPILKIIGGIIFCVIILSAFSMHQSKITICHKGNIQITVSTKSLPAHLAHGDKIGRCCRTDPTE